MHRAKLNANVMLRALAAASRLGSAEHWMTTETDTATGNKSSRVSAECSLTERGEGEDDDEDEADAEEPRRGKKRMENEQWRQTLE